jgi:ubiquinone/menaquinone biosynthesis C-methylase UbiE
VALTYFAAFNPLVSKFTYRFQTRMAASDVVFLNWGYEENPPMALPLAKSDEPSRYAVQLYHRTATQIDLTGKRVLEVGCGHGGGASYLMRTLRPASYTGLDLNRAAIAFCRKRHILPGVDFVYGNAEKLPFPDQSFDAVINIESSGAYPHFSRFLAEVARVLRPGGHFLYADLRPRNSIAKWELALAEAPMRMLSHHDINEQVLCGMAMSTPRMLHLIGRMPRYLRRIGREFCGVKGTKFYLAIQSGKYSYRMYCLTRPVTDRNRLSLRRDLEVQQSTERPAATVLPLARPAPRH